jgi:CheY-like chemotaxis protein
VDDEADLLEVAEAYLTGLGYRVVTASNGRQALNLLERNPSIDVLFSDVVMPGGMNGFELAEEAVARYGQLKVLLTSGFTNRAMARNGQARFNANLLIKPYNEADLALRLRSILDGEIQGPGG